MIIHSFLHKTVSQEMTAFKVHDRPSETLKNGRWVIGLRLGTGTAIALP